MSIYSKIVNFFRRVFNHDETQILIKLLSNDMKLFPLKAHWDDSGYDIRSAETKTVVIKPGETVSVGCGFAMGLPLGYEAQIRPRSGLALKHQISVLNSPGTIDCGYHGEVKVILTNFGKTEFKVRYGDRIAQMVIAEAPPVVLLRVTKLRDSCRGTDGFGSSGTK